MATVWRAFKSRIVVVTMALFAAVVVAQFDDGGDIAGEPVSYILNSDETTLRTCEPVKINYCLNIGYNTTGMPNLFGHETQREANDNYRTFEQLLQYDCSTQLQFFLCSVHVPMCSPQLLTPIGPCRPLCESVRDACEPTLLSFGFTWPPPLNCSRFPETNGGGPDGSDMCMQGPEPGQRMGGPLAGPPSPPQGALSPNGPPGSTFGSRIRPSHNDEEVQSTPAISRRPSGAPGKQPATASGGWSSQTSTKFGAAGSAATAIEAGATTSDAANSNAGRSGPADVSGGDAALVGGEPCAGPRFVDRQLVSFVNESRRCATRCGRDVLYSADSKRFAEIWMAVWSVAAFMSSLFTVLLYFVDRSRFGEPPDRAVVYLCTCYCLQCVGYFVRLVVGRTPAACALATLVFDRALPQQATVAAPAAAAGAGVAAASVRAAASTVAIPQYSMLAGPVLVHQGLNTNYYCSVIFAFIHYFSNAATMWWLVLIVIWFMHRRCCACCARAAVGASSTMPPLPPVTPTTTTPAARTATSNAITQMLPGGGLALPAGQISLPTSHHQQQQQQQLLAVAATRHQQVALLRRRRTAAIQTAAWCLPAIMTMSVLIMGVVDADELTGVCYVGNQNRDTLLAFVILPQAVTLAIGGALLLVGALSIRCSRNGRQLASTAVTAAVSGAQRQHQQQPNYHHQSLVKSPATVVEPRGQSASGAVSAGGVVSCPSGETLRSCGCCSSSLFAATSTSLSSSSSSAPSPPATATTAAGDCCRCGKDSGGVGDDTSASWCRGDWSRSTACAPLANSTHHHHHHHQYVNGGAPPLGAGVGCYDCTAAGAAATTGVGSSSCCCCGSCAAAVCGQRWGGGHAMRRLWMFCVHCAIPTLCVLGVNIFEYVHRDAWTSLTLKGDSGAAAADAALSHQRMSAEWASRPRVEYFSFKMAMSVAVGITAGLWTWCSKRVITLPGGATAAAAGGGGLPLSVAANGVCAKVNPAGGVAGSPPVLVTTPFQHAPIMLPPNQYIVPERLVHQIQQQQQQHQQQQQLPPLHTLQPQLQRRSHHQHEGQFYESASGHIIL